MSDKIYYFTGTGNSLAVAENIAARLDSATLIEITAGSEPVMTDADSVGIIFPVYCCGIPRIVYDFIKRVVIRPDTYVYAVATYGGTPGAANRQIQNMLAEKNIILSAGFIVKMPGNYIPLYDIISEKKQEILFDEKDKKVVVIADSVRQRKKVPVESTLGLIGMIIIKVLYPAAIKSFKTSDSSFTVDPGCTSCSLCMRVCPRANITMTDGKPVWHHDCESCFACVHWCPQQVIQSGRKTRNRKRYHNSSVSVQDVLKRS